MTEQGTLTFHKTGEQLRDEALRRVAESAGSWTDRALEALRYMRRVTNETHATGEDVRLFCEDWNIRPHHRNAWGSLINTAIKRGLLRPTDTFRKMRTPRSHARITRVYYLPEES